MPTEAALRGIGDLIYEKSRSLRTETREDADAALQIGNRPRRYETDVGDLGPREVFSGAERPARERQLSLSDTSALKSVPAVVTGIDEHTIVIACHLPRGEVEVRLPKGLVPPDLAVFGKPVSLSLDESSGFRRVVLVEREIERRAPTPEEVEIDEWIES